MSIFHHRPGASSISGTYLGIGAIPAKWIKEIEKTDYLDDLSVLSSNKKLNFTNRELK